MPDLFDCLQSAMNAGDMDPKRGQETQQLFTELWDQYAQTMPQAAAAAKATEDTKRIVSPAHAGIDPPRGSRRARRGRLPRACEDRPRLAQTGGVIEALPPAHARIASRCVRQRGARCRLFSSQRRGLRRPAPVIKKFH